MRYKLAGRVPEDMSSLVQEMTDEDFDAIFGTPEQQEEAWQTFAEDRAFLRQRSLELEFPNEWVAGHKCKVLAHAATWEQLRDEMMRLDVWGRENAIRQMPPL